MIMAMGEHQHEVGKIDKSRNQLLGELLTGQCDVVLVDRECLPHRLYRCRDEVIRCRERVALFEGLNDEGDFPSRLPGLSL